MMRKGAILACVGMALVASACDLTTERRYVNEGAGIDLYTADRAGQVELLNQYVDFICAQVSSSPDCGGNWSTFVLAGMNDIDQRCDGFLTWLDKQRRDKEPVLSELSAINTAVHAIMTVTGASPKSLDIVTAAFGLATATYTNWNSRLLISVNQSTVQEVVYKSQGQYRDKIKAWPIRDKPTAVYLLRNYLRLCTPITIEASINTITTLVQRDATEEAKESLVVTTTKQPQTLRFVAPTSDLAVKIQTYYDAATENRTKVNKWLKDKKFFMGFAGFIVSGNLAAFRAMIHDLDI